MNDTPSFKILAPKLPSSPTILDPKLLIAGATLSKFELHDVDLGSLNARGLDISGASLARIELDGAKLTKLLANDTVLQRLNLTAADCSESSFIRCELNDGRMTGWDANMSSFEDVVFRGCKLDMANFRAAKFERVRFIDCILTEADFLGATLEHVAFQNCLLDKAQFSQCKMADVDLRSSELIEISGWQSLKGATIDSVQLTAAAPYLAHELDIKIVD